jgi:5-methylcytosine-specific restriction endonuclease McrA
MTATLTRPVLVLDAGYQAVNVVPMRKALVLVTSGKAVPVEEDKAVVFHSERRRFHAPVIIRLLIAIAHRVYRRYHVRFNKRNIMARDGYACQYCGTSGVPLTIDHVVPRSRRTLEYPEGGPTAWDNCVAACFPCNTRKGSRTPEEAGLRLRSVPARPRWFFPLVHRKRGTAPAGPHAQGDYQQWSKYLLEGAAALSGPA